MRRALSLSQFLAMIVFCTRVCGGDPPNIVLFLIDDLGRQDMNCEGSQFHETPNIDRIAAQGVRFTNAYAACQVCSPSRAAIQTGRYPQRLKITDYIGAPEPDQWKRNTKLLPAPYQKQLDLNETTIAEALMSKGYQTFFAGKWHLGGEGFLPTDQGYSINKGGNATGSPAGGFFSPYKNPLLPDGPPGELLPLRLARETADFIRHSKRNSASPFFAMLSFYSVHAPIQTTQELWKKYRDKAISMGADTKQPRFHFDRTQEVRQIQDNPLYAGMMESLDTAVGMVLDALKESGASQNTVIVFTSDNGGVSSGDGYATSCLPFRGGKGRQWEGGIRTPLYIYWPGVTHGTQSTSMASHIDLMPTLLEVAGAGAKELPSIDGVSLVPALQGKEMPDRKLYWHYPHYGNQGGEPSAITRHGRWKLIHYFEDDHDELYDIEADVGERSDLAKQHTDRVNSMRADLEAWQRSVGAITPTINTNFSEDKHQAELKRIVEVQQVNREREHARFLSADFVPNGGWWQDSARKRK
jgi:arylsulfatase A-like enzyme